MTKNIQRLALAVAAACVSLCAPAQSLDTTFIAGQDAIYPGPDPSAGSWDRVRAIALQPDGRIVVGGSFTYIGMIEMTGIARLAPDGAIDTGFTAPPVRADTIAVLPDGKLLIAGRFADVGGTPRPGIARLNADGTLDTAFAPGDWSNGGRAPNVAAFAVQPDGRIVAAGNAYDAADLSVISVFRLNADGTNDTTFARPAIETYYGGVSGFALDADGKVLLGGRFTSVNGQARDNIARLNADGSVDTAFNPGADGDVMSLVPLPDGRILAAGHFTTLAGSTNGNVVRIAADGQLDATFSAGPFDGGVTSVAPAVDGSLLVAGTFWTVGDTSRPFVARLGADGALDASYAVATGDWTMSLARQIDGKAFVAGGFVTVDGVARNHIARLAANGDATGTLAAPGDVRWTFGDAAPAFSRATLETSDDGTTWSAPVAGTPLARGWSFAASLPVDRDVWVRARGVASGSFSNATYSLIEQKRQLRGSDTIFAHGFEAAAR
ncbi:hypothetical protein [Tahibacter soli]|uniref:Delta-60 repeat protein n=1 Tax=Tahibacter soli TaxID=2983605 RepID=A0A9X3YM82_9GAMM|nr:hypothetical protein [Tahibacter soli]MDC8014857.1 hypothetical protein [Tahibacter soli]